MQQIIDVMLRATGVNVFTSQMAQIVNASNAVQRAVSLTQTAMGAAFGGFTLSAITNVGSEFEKTQNKMAGFLVSLEAIGELQPNFTPMQQGLGVASALMKQIEISAAALPGEAEDYVTVFTTTLPAVQKSLGGTLKEMTAFTNQFTAVGSSLGIDSAQLAGDLNRLLQVGRGGAGMDVRSWTSMLPFLQRVEGQADITAEKFNKMDAAARAALLKQVVFGNGIKDMIDNASNGWEALSGTVVSVTKTMFRLGSQPLFEGMKDGARSLAGMFQDSEGNLTVLGTRVAAVGRIISTGLVEGVRAAAGGIGWMINNFDELYSRVKGAVLPIFETKIDMVVNALPALGNALDLLVGSVEPLYTALMSLNQVVGPLSTAMLGIIVNAIEPLAIGISSFVEAIAEWIGRLVPMIANIAGWLIPPIEKLGGALGKLIQGFLHFAGPIIGFLASGVVKIVELLAPVVGFLIDRLAEFGRGVGEILEWLGDKMRQWFGMSVGGPGNKAPVSQTLAKGAGGLAEFLANFKAGMAWSPAALSGTAGFDLNGMPKGASKMATPAARGGTKVHQDFRNSRFTIDQKFEEGFDPDRVGGAFASALQKIGETKLQSGFDPLFSVY